MFSSYWRKRCVEAEAKIAQLEAERTASDKRAFIIGISRSGRMNRFTFVRNNVTHVIATMGTWNDDIEAWKKTLFGDGSDG